MDPKNVDPTMMNNEMKKQGMVGDAKRPPGQRPGHFLHQDGGSAAKRYPIILAGAAVASGLFSWMYYAATKEKEQKSMVPTKAPQ